jgi:hypothetical protein
MQPNAPDLMDLRIRLFLVVVGTVLAVIGWARYLMG